MRSLLQHVKGKVLNLEISEMSGSKYGTILVQTCEGQRFNFKYDTNSSGENMSINFNGSMYMQYKIHMETTNDNSSPQVNSVTFE